MAAHLQLVQSLSQLQRQQRHAEEIDLSSVGLTLERGSLTEITGEASSGKTSLSLTLLARQTRLGEICAVVDSTGGFDPCTATLAGVRNENLLWVKCGSQLESAFMAADYLVQAKGFGVIWLNLNGLSREQLRLVPRTYWYRYRTRIRETSTVLLVTAGEPIAGSACQNSFVLKRDQVRWSGTGRFKLLREFHLSRHAQKRGFGPAVPTVAKFDYSEI